MAGKLELQKKMGMVVQWYLIGETGRRREKVLFEMLERCALTPILKQYGSS